MAVFAALVLAAAPLAAPLPSGVTLIGSVRAEILRAERVSLEAGPDSLQRSAVPERDGVIIHFD